MSNCPVIEMNQFEITPGRTINPDSKFIAAACMELEKEGDLIKENEFETSFDIFKVILKCHELANLYDDKRGNENAKSN